LFNNPLLQLVHPLGRDQTGSVLKAVDSRWLRVGIEFGVGVVQVNSAIVGHPLGRKETNKPIRHSLKKRKEVRKLSLTRTG